MKTVEASDQHTMEGVALVVRSRHVVGFLMDCHTKRSCSGHLNMWYEADLTVSRQSWEKEFGFKLVKFIPGLCFTVGPSRLPRLVGVKPFLRWRVRSPLSAPALVGLSAAATAPSPLCTESGRQQRQQRKQLMWSWQLVMTRHEWSSGNPVLGKSSLPKSWANCRNSIDLPNYRVLKCTKHEIKE